MLYKGNLVMMLINYTCKERFRGVFRLTWGCFEIRHFVERLISKPSAGGEC